VPLSMAINALTMLLAPFLIPLLMVLLAGSSVNINAGALFQQLAVLLLIPLILGMAARWVADLIGDVKAYIALMPALSALTAVLLMFAVCNVNVPLIAARWAQVPALLAAIVLIFPLGFLVPHVLGRSLFTWRERVAVTYASGMKNLPIAVGLAFASFSELAGLPVALAMILQMLTASLFYRYLNRHSPLPPQPATAVVKDKLLVKSNESK